MDEVLTKEQQEEVARKIECIRAYEAGDETLVDAVIDIIIEIDDYTHYAKKEVRVHKRYLFYYKAAAFFMPGNFDEKKLLQSVDSTLALYFECIDILKKYIKVGNATDNFPDLEAAYLLTIYLSALLLNVADYFEEINTMKNAEAFGYAYSNNYLEQKCEERRSMVKTLALAILPDNNNEKI